MEKFGLNIRTDYPILKMIGRITIIKVGVILQQVDYAILPVISTNLGSNTG